MSKFKVGDIICSNVSESYFNILEVNSKKTVYTLRSFSTKFTYGWPFAYVETNCRLATQKEIEELKIKSILT